VVSFWELLTCDCEHGSVWICEEHPDRGFPHDDCSGPGMPCPHLRAYLDAVAKAAGPR
jgi:hypothetical protein